MIKNLFHVRHTITHKTYATGHLSHLSGIQSTYSPEPYSLGGLSCVLTHTWKTFCSLHMICITCMSLNRKHLLAFALWATTKTKIYIALKYLISLQLRTMEHSLWLCFFLLNYINKCMIKSCTGAPRQLFEAGWHSCIHVSLHTKSNVPLCSSGVN